MVEVTGWLGGVLLSDYLSCGEDNRRTPACQEVSSRQLRDHHGVRPDNAIFHLRGISWHFHYHSRVSHELSICVGWLVQRLAVKYRKENMVHNCIGLTRRVQTISDKLNKSLLMRPLTYCPRFQTSISFVHFHIRIPQTH